MQIIIMHSRLVQAKSVTLSSKHVYAFIFAIFLFILLGAVLMMGITSRIVNSDSKFVRGLIPEALMSNLGSPMMSQDRYLKENLNAMAVKLGEMQAQIIRLDALGERVQGLAGVKPEDFNFKEPPSRGGMEVPISNLGNQLSLVSFQSMMDNVGKDLNYRSDYLNVVESKLMGYKMQAKLLPTIAPVNVGYNASSFGYRLDPFTGRSAMHEGLDFSAASGTPIVAAAGGVVIAAEYHPEFGNMVEIDHGADMMTRYAHASKLLVKVGDIVRRGQHIANIGSTGRSTGSHLHFEVRIKGVPQNPQKFLNAGLERISSPSFSNLLR
jgi:murein DD-endopeptidase MepM/ murein hydrolase activator NlpD